MKWKIKKRKDGKHNGTVEIYCDTVHRLMMLISRLFLPVLFYLTLQVISLVMYERYSQSDAGVARVIRPGHSVQRAFVFSNAVAQVLVFISSGCNPILYGIFNRNYRQLFYCAVSFVSWQVITSAKEVMFLPVFVCLFVSLQDNFKSYGRIFLKF